MNTETNIFRITNLADLSAEYRLYRVKGLTEGQEDYYRNVNSLVNRLSRQLRSPVTFVQRDGVPYLVISEDKREVETEHPVDGRTAYLEKGSDVLPVNFGIDSRFASCRFAERVQADEFRKLLVEAAVHYSKKTGEFARTIVVYRDGRMFEPEQVGARQAMDFLISEGYVAHGATLTCLEIPKRSLTPLRLFEVSFDRANRRPHSANPSVGRYYIANDSEGYVCCTGNPFDRRGTVSPLHVKKVFGPLLIADCLEDVYWLTVLAWTRPEDCTRYPINIKINDRRLFEDAATYDEHELQTHDEETKR